VSAESLPQVIRCEQDDQGVATLIMDDPRRPVNVVDEAFLHSLGAALDELEARRSGITGVLITSAKRSFSAGADLDDLSGLGPARVSLMGSRITAFAALFRRLETLGRPVVAVINGSAVGAGYELALACHYRVALDAPGARIGLPEATLGLLPDLGGVTRSVRLVGIEVALRDVLLPGTLHVPARALELGMVDALVGDASELIPAALRWARSHPAPVQPWDVPDHRDLVSAEPPSAPADVTSLADALGIRLDATTAVQHRIVAAAAAGAAVDFAAALAIERHHALECARDPRTGEMIRDFLNRRG
jgi:3-hydroxyacyl-CoA dehydrogenase/enoyl-CoA hydratase/3-hydroxybutyryl-CoA epimerase